MVDTRGRRGRTDYKLETPRRRKAHHAIPVKLCYLHGEPNPVFSCQGCINVFESDRDHAALDEEV